MPNLRRKLGIEIDYYRYRVFTLQDTSPLQQFFLGSSLLFHYMLTIHNILALINENSSRYPRFSSSAFTMEAVFMWRKVLLI